MSEHYSEAKRHAKTARGNEHYRPYKCKYCGASIRGQLCFYIEHIIRHHSTDPEDSTCSKCKKIFESGKAMLAHYDNCGKEGISVCDICGFVAKAQMYLKRLVYIC